MYCLCLHESGHSSLSRELWCWGLGLLPDLFSVGRGRRTLLSSGCRGRERARVTGEHCLCQAHLRVRFGKGAASPQQTPDSSQPWEESLASVSHLDTCRQREVRGGEGPFPLKSRLIAQLCPAHNSNQPPCLRSVKSQDRAGLAIATCR